MYPWGLPESAEINGREFAIRSDFRAALDVIRVMSDASIPGEERGMLAMALFYPESGDPDAVEGLCHLDDMRASDAEEAGRFIRWFVDGGTEGHGGEKGRMMDWSQDYRIIVPPVSRVLGYDPRSRGHVHWWTFLGAYMEVGDCLFASVVSCRRKKAQGKMDKADREFYRKNRDLVDFHAEPSEADESAIEGWL